MNTINPGGATPATEPRPKSRMDMRGSHRDRGSVLLFAVVVVLLLAMMGAAYMQMARLDRRATRDTDTTVNTNAGSIIRFIGAILAEDVLGQGQEPYDYPWTNPNVTFPVDSFWDPEATLGNARGGVGDDMWLASNVPDFSTGQPRWPHLTNLRGHWFDLNDLIPDPLDPTRQVWREYTSTADNNINTGDTNVLFTSLDPEADATGDGIPDSRWTYAPLSSPGLVWVMAVRIVDNSGMINVDTWTLPPRVGPADNLPRFLWPSELDMDLPLTSPGRFTHQSALIPDLVDAIVQHRIPAFAGGGQPTNFTGPGGRYWHWLNGPRLWGNYNGATDLNNWTTLGVEGTGQESGFGAPGTSYERFGRLDELEMRWRGGLNRSSDNDVNDPPTTLEDLDNGAYHAFWRQNGPVETTYDDTPHNTFQTFFEDEPRKHITTYSGAGTFFRTDLNQAGENALRQLALLATQNAMPTINPWGDDEAFADRFAATVLDWRDEPGELTRVGDAFGMEYLPFVSEVYVVQRYEAVSVTPIGEPPVTEESVVWAYDTSVAMIEVVNPWGWEVPVPEVELRVGNENWGSLRDLIGDSMDGNEQIVIVLGDETNPPAPAGGARVVSAPGDAEWPTGGTEIELRAPVAGQAEGVVYQRFPTLIAPTNTVTMPYPAGTFTVGDVGYRRAGHRGTATGLNALTVRSQDAADDIDGQIQAVASPPPSTRFNQAGKNNAAADNVLVQDAAEPRFYIPSHRIYRAGDVMRMVLLGPTTTRTVAEVFHDAQTDVPSAAQNRLSAFMLDLADTQRVGTRDRAVNHAAFILGRVTTLSPENDGQDNDGDGRADNPGERLVPGLINVNTAPLWLIEDALPLPNNAAGNAYRTAILDAIIDGRADPSSLGFPTDRTSRGIAYLSEIAQRVTGDPTGAFANFNEYHPDLGPDGAWPATRDSQLTPLSYLNQVLTTRSDVFTAYVRVRAYDAAALDDDPLTDYRLVIVYDRSVVGERRPLPRVLGVAVVREP
jgi:hypothetical protein